MSVTTALCEKMLTSKPELLGFSNTIPRRYKVYRIKKRNGVDTRLIAHPARTVKFIQRLVVEELRKILPIHSCATAYEKGGGIKINALRHKNNKYLLKMDFKNFFLSITPELFFQIAHDTGVYFDEDDKTLLEGVLFWRLKRTSPLRLSVGAPSSPFISNFVMFLFDVHVDKVCQELGIVYTRYADDLTFTTNKKDVLFSVPAIVKQHLKGCCLSKVKINSEKTVFSSKAFNRHVTGVTLTNENKISVGREKKRMVSAKLHRFSLGALNDEQVASLKGQLAHINHIEPDFIARMQRKYSVEVIAALFCFNQSRSSS